MKCSDGIDSQTTTCVLGHTPHLWILGCGWLKMRAEGKARREAVLAEAV